MEGTERSGWVPSPQSTTTASPARDGCVDRPLHILFSFFALGDFAAFAQVCKRWHSISENNDLWKARYIKHFHSDPPPSEIVEEPKAKQQFRLAHQWVTNMNKGEWFSHQISRLITDPSRPAFIIFRKRKEAAPGDDEGFLMRPDLLTQQDPMQFLVYCWNQKQDFQAVVRDQNSYVPIMDFEFPPKRISLLRSYSANYPDSFTMMVTWPKFDATLLALSKQIGIEPPTEGKEGATCFYQIRKAKSSSGYEAICLLKSPKHMRWHRSTLTIGSERYLLGHDRRELKEERGSVALYSLDEQGVPSTRPAIRLPGCLHNLKKLATFSREDVTYLVGINKFGNIRGWGIQFPTSKGFGEWVRADQTSTEPEDQIGDPTAAFLAIPKATKTDSDLLLSQVRSGELLLTDPFTGHMLSTLGRFPQVRKVSTFASSDGARYIVALADKVHICSLEKGMFIWQSDTCDHFTLVRGPDSPYLLTVKTIHPTSSISGKHLICRWRLLNRGEFKPLYLGLTNWPEHADVKGLFMRYPSRSGFDVVLFAAAIFYTRPQPNNQFASVAWLWNFNEPKNIEQKEERQSSNCRVS